MPQNVSIVFPGQTDVTATGGAIGIMTREAAPGGSAVTYTFVASEPGTYTYYSGTSPELQRIDGACRGKNCTPYR